VKDDLHQATVAVLAETGWDGLTLERVAEKAGKSRVTLWRNGVTRESLLTGLLKRLAEDYRDAMLPVLTAGGDPADRLRKTMAALCDVVDAHTDVLTLSDEMFHRAAETADLPMKFLDPFIAVLRDARAAGRLLGKGTDLERADILFNAVAWTYLHLRARHAWAPAKARNLLLPMLIEGTIR